MNNKNSYKIVDNYQIEFYNNEIEQLQRTGQLKIKQLLLPAPLDVLINEYDSKFKVESRDILGPLKGENKSFIVFKEYTKTLNNDLNQGSILYITDRYLFADVSPEYLKIILNVLIDIKIAEIKYIIPNGFASFESCSFEYIRNELKQKQIKIEIINSDLFHDRFWISNLSGFVCGTSLNGLSKRTSIIQRLDPLDYIDIYKILKTI